MYQNKLKDILNDLENPNTHIAGGSVVGVVLSTINSLIIYSCNLTIGKPKYQEVEPQVKDILTKAQTNKEKSLNSIDQDNDILEELLSKYKTRKEDPESYEEICTKAVEFALEVISLAYQTKELSKEISKVGNKMLSSDYNICLYLSKAAIKSSYENYFINLGGIQNEEIKNNFNQTLLEIENKYKGE